MSALESIRTAGVWIVVMACWVVLSAGTPFAGIAAKFPGNTSYLETTVVFTVQVSSADGDPISGVHVNVWTARHVIVSPPVYQAETDTRGIARFNVQVPSGESLYLSVEVSREDMQTETWSNDFGTSFPTRLPLQKFTLRPRTGNGDDQTSVSISINVRDDQDNSVEGAQIEIGNWVWEPRKWRGTTGPDGSVTISVPGTVAKGKGGKAVWAIKASKQGYHSGGTSITTSEKEFGTTVSTETIKLGRTSRSDISVIVTVTDDQTKNPVAGAVVALNGAASSDSATTNGSGKATLHIAGSGDYSVSITSEKYYDGGGSIRVLKDESSKAEEFSVKAKESADAGNDTLTVTVTGKDPTDVAARPAPIPNAKVTDGRTTQTTDAAGQATLKGVFDGEYSVTAIADGYTSQTKAVGVHGDGNASFSLDPQLSENSPFRLIVEVSGPASERVKGASVAFYASGRGLPGGVTNDNGDKDFRSASDAPGIPVSDLRRGITINVTAKGYKPVGNRAIPVDLLAPALTATTYPVVLERDWSELTNAVASLEAKVTEWNNDKGQLSAAKGVINGFIDKALEARKRAEQLLNEIKAGRDAFGVGVGPGAESPFKKVDALQQEILASSTQANQDADDLKKTLDSANDALSKCSTAADAESIRSSYRKGIKLLGDIGVLNKKAVKDRDDLVQLAQQSLALKALAEEMRSRVRAITNMVDIASGAATGATQYNLHLADIRNSLLKRQIALKAEIDGLRTRFGTDTTGIPLTGELSDLRKRIDAIGAGLDTNSDASYNLPVNPQSAQDIPASITDAVTAISNINLDAENLVEQFESAARTVETMDQTVDGIQTTLNNASFDIGLSADLPKQANDCASGSAPKDNATSGSGEPSGDKPKVEDLPEDRSPTAGSTRGSTAKNPLNGNNQSRVIEQLPEDKPGTTTTVNNQANKPKVEEIPDGSDVAVSGGGQKAPMSKAPAVEPIPDSADQSTQPVNGSSSKTTPTVPSTGNGKSEKKPRDPNQPTTLQKLAQITTGIIDATSNQDSGDSNSGGGSTDPGGKTGGTGGSGGGGKRVIDLSGAWTVNNDADEPDTWRLVLRQTSSNEWRGTPVDVRKSYSKEDLQEITVRVAGGRLQALIPSVSASNWYDVSYSGSSFTIKTDFYTFTGVRQ